MKFESDRNLSAEQFRAREVRASMYTRIIVGAILAVIIAYFIFG